MSGAMFCRLISTLANLTPGLFGFCLWDYSVVIWFSWTLLDSPRLHLLAVLLVLVLNLGWVRRLISIPFPSGQFYLYHRHHES